MSASWFVSEWMSVIQSGRLFASGSVSAFQTEWKSSFDWAFESMFQ